MSIDVPMYRLLPYLRRRKAARKARLERKEPLRFHLKRTTAQIGVYQGLAKGHSMSMATLLLSDITLHGVKVFAANAMYPGQKISLTVESPRMLFIRGEVVSCREISRDSGVISLYPARYRVLIAFEFKHVEERIALKHFLDQIAKFNEETQLAV